MAFAISYAAVGFTCVVRLCVRSKVPNLPLSPQVNPFPPPTPPLSPALFVGFIGVESGEVGLIALPPPARSNGSCSFPASRFPMWVALIGEGWFVFQGRGGSAARVRSLR